MLRNTWYENPVGPEDITGHGGEEHFQIAQC